MELVQELFELLFGDVLVAATGGSLTAPLGLAAVQGVEHGVELGVGIAVVLAPRGGLGRCGFFSSRGRLGQRGLFRLCRCLRRGLGGLATTGPGGLGQLLELAQQFRLGGLGHDAVAHRVEHVVEDVEHREDDIHELGIDLALMVAQDVEDVLGAVAELHQRCQTDKAGTALDGVEAAEDGVEQIGIIGALFELDQLLLQLLQDLAGLDQEVL